MARVTILGAGDMGTALATPLAANGHDVSLWGTERDVAIVAEMRSGGTHPRLGVRLPKGGRIYPADQAPDALDGADLVVVAVTSDAVRPILERLAPHLGKPRAIMTVAKGFDAGADGTSVQLLPETIREFSVAPVVAVGGPSKANEVAHGQPTGVVFGSTDAEALAWTQTLFQTPVYRVAPTDDIVGLEISAAMKNAYAIALGVADGLERRTGRPHHNLQAALFPIAVAEMAALAQLRGGRAETACALAGAGDLQVTITSGRNRLLGERIGLGEAPETAVAALSASGTTIEGYPAVAFGHRLAAEARQCGTAYAGSLRLLEAIWQILYQGADSKSTLVRIL